MPHPVLLSDGNAKMDKNTAQGWLTWSLQLAPGRMSGREVCPSRGSCYATCLFLSGRGAMASTAQARVRRTKMYYEKPQAFAQLLSWDIGNLVKRADYVDLRPSVRLNAFSDIAWEHAAPELFDEHKDVQFYDYTKRADRFERWLDGRLPDNYHLAFSSSERAKVPDMLKYREKGGQLVVVVRDRLPPWIKKKWVVDGDEHDLLFMHPKGSVLTLTPKGPAVRNRTEFIP